MAHPSSKHASGYTMMELIITMAIAAILAAVAIPSFQVISANAARREASSSLYSAYQRARSESLARNALVSVCPQLEGSAIPACATDAGDYTDGWLVFLDGADTSQPDNVFQTHGEVNDTVSIVGTPNVVSFDANGRSSATLAISIATTLEPDNLRCLTVERSGRISLLEANPCAPL